MTLPFPELLRLIDERSAAFRAAIAGAPDLDARVPTCPDWTLFDLAEHLGQGRRRWAAIVAAGPASTPPDFTAPEAPKDRDALVGWLADGTRELGDALREAGPDRGCWTWWAPSQSPQTTGAVARHQLQQVAVHTYDAQLAAGAAQPMPADVAVDGVDEFLHTCCATTAPWPHDPAVVEYHATEGRSWRLHLSAGGARVEPVSTAGPADATGRGTAADLVLFLYGRDTQQPLELTGDRQIFDRLAAWEPEV